MAGKQMQIRQKHMCTTHMLWWCAKTYRVNWALEMILRKPDRATLCLQSYIGKIYDLVVPRSDVLATRLNNTDRNYDIFSHNYWMFIWKQRDSITSRLFLEYIIASRNYENCISLLCTHRREKEKRKRSDSILWQKPLHQQKCQKGKVTTQKTP